MHTFTTADLDFEFTLSDLQRLDFALPYATFIGPDRLALAGLLLQVQCPEKMCAHYFIANRHHLKDTAKQMDRVAMAKAQACATGTQPKHVNAYSTALFRMQQQIDSALTRDFAPDLKQMDWPDNLVLEDDETKSGPDTSNAAPPGEPWYDAGTWSAAYAEANASKSDDSREWKRALESMQDTGTHKRYATLPSLSTFESLKSSHPNFTEVIDFVAAEVALGKRKKTKGFSLPPLLLEGPAGVGKSHFAHALAGVIGTDVRTLNMASQSAGFVLAGLHRSWSGGCMGEVATSLKRSATLSPIFFLDELDKATREGKSDPVGPLYALLEKDSAARFSDEYLVMEINASQIIWLAAANDASCLPHPLLSRFARFAIASPTPHDMRRMAQAHYQQLRDAWSELPAAMPNTWLNALESLSMRAMGQQLERALGRAAIRAELAETSLVDLREEDMQADSEKKARMGFLAG